MQAIEFESYVENGVIKIPLQYQNTIARSVRVIVFPRESHNGPKDTEKKKKLYSLAVNMSGFCFDRNEINER